MDDRTLDTLEITQLGREALGRLISNARTSSGQTNWEDFAEYMRESTQIDIKKDTIWKAAEGNYNRSPSLSLTYALLALNEFTFVGSSRRPTLSDVMGILTQRIDEFGNSVQANHQDPGHVTH